MKKIWLILTEFVTGVKIWFRDIPCIMRWCKSDFDKKVHDGKYNKKKQ